jgi:hypothetical protein
MLQPILLVSPDTSRSKIRRRIISFAFSGVMGDWIYLGKSMIPTDDNITRDMSRERLGQG